MISATVLTLTLYCYSQSLEFAELQVERYVESSTKPGFGLSGPLLLNFMRLQSFIPAIPRDLVAALEACGIRTDTDFLFSGTPIDILQRLPSGVISLADLKTYIALVTETASARGIRGDALYTEELQRQCDYDTDLSCGVDELDALVGGFGNGRVFEISGDKGSGKTVRKTRIHHLFIMFLIYDVSRSCCRLLCAGC